MVTQVLKLPLTEEYAERMEWADLKKLINALGDFRDGIVSLTEIVVKEDGARFRARAFRNGDALLKRAPLPDVTPVDLFLSWDEINSSEKASEVVRQARAAVWHLMMQSSKLLRGTQPPTGEPETRQHLFSGGELIEV